MLGNDRGQTLSFPTVRERSIHEQFDEFDASDKVTPARRRAMIMIALGEYLDGYDLIAIGGALLQLHDQFRLTPSQTGLLGASAFFGATVGLLVAGAIADRLGRRAIFVHVFWVFAILSVLSACIQSYTQLFVMRLLLGMVIGADIAISIPFLGEISPRKSRGRWAGAAPQIAWTLGAISSLGVALTLTHLIGSHAWRWLFGLGAIPAIIILIGRHSIPESPRWLLSQGRVAEAEAAMETFGLGSAALNAPKTSVATEPGDNTAASLDQAAVAGSYFDIFRPPYTRQSLLVMMILTFSPLVGSAASVAAPYVLHFVGALSSEASLAGSLFTWVGGLCGSLLALFTTERLGRIRSSAFALWGSASCLILLVLSVKVPALFVATFVFYGVSVWFGASSNWLLPTELLPTHLRARAQGLGTGASRMMTGFTTWLVPTGVAAFGFPTTFIMLSLVGVSLGAFVLTNLRFEAAGRSLDDIVGA